MNDRQPKTVRLLNLGLDTGTPTGKLMLMMLGGVAEFERSMMLERQRESIAKAKCEGKYKGCKLTSRAKADQVRALKVTRKSMSAIADELEISFGSVHATLKVPAEMAWGYLLRRSPASAFLTPPLS